MVEYGPVFYALAVVVLLFVFLVFLFVRRTLAGFREGFEGGRNGRE